MEKISSKKRLTVQENLGPIRAPKGCGHNIIYSNYLKEKREKDKFIKISNIEINKDIEKKEQSEIFNMIKACLVVEAIYLACIYRKNLGYFKENLIHALKRKS